MSVTEIAPENSSSTASETCPRCHTTKSWGENSWCPDCGYYPVVDSAAPEGSSWADDLPDEPVEDERDDRTALQSIPAWFWVMIGGVVAIALSSVGIRMMFHADDQEATRGTIALIQLFTGATAMLVAHVLATKFAMANDRRLNLFDFVIAWFAIWQPTIISLPRTCRRVLAMVWGIVAVITATTIIGGIDYAAPFRTEREAAIKPANIISAVTAAAQAQATAQGDQPGNMGDALNELNSQVGEMGGDGAGSGKSMQEAFDELGDMDGTLDQLTGGLEDSLGDLSNMTPEEIAEKLQQQMLAERSIMECFVYGVVVNKRKVPTAFLFAAELNGEEQHVAEVAGKDLKKRVYKSLVTKLSKVIQEEPVIDSDRDAIWVSPDVTCKLSFQNLSRDGEMVEPELDAIVVKQRGRFDTSYNGSQSSTERR